MDICLVAGATTLRDKIVGAEYFLNFVEGLLHLFACVGCHEAEADQGVMRCYGWCHNWVDKDAFLEKVAGDGKCLEVVADEERDDGC